MFGSQELVWVKQKEFSHRNISLKGSSPGFLWSESESHKRWEKRNGKMNSALDVEIAYGEIYMQNKLVNKAGTK